MSGLKARHFKASTGTTKSRMRDLVVLVVVPVEGLKECLALRPDTPLNLLQELLQVLLSRACAT